MTGPSRRTGRPRTEVLRRARRGDRLLILPDELESGRTLRQERRAWLSAASRTGRRVATSVSDAGLEIQVVALHRSPRPGRNGQPAAVPLSDGGASSSSSRSTAASRRAAGSANRSSSRTGRKRCSGGSSNCGPMVGGATAGPSSGSRRSKERCSRSIRRFRPRRDGAPWEIWMLGIKSLTSAATRARLSPCRR